MAKTNNLLFAGIGLGAAYLLTRHETKIEQTKTDLTFVNTRLDEHGNAIADLQAGQKDLYDRYANEEGTAPEMVKECCPIDATLKIGDMWSSENNADYRLFMRFQNLNKVRDLQLSIEIVQVDINGWVYQLEGDKGAYIASFIINKNTKATEWKLVYNETNGKWFGKSTIGAMMARIYNSSRANNRRGHFYPAKVNVYYKVFNPQANKVSKYGGWAYINCEFMEESFLTRDWEEPLLKPNENYKQARNSYLTLYEAGISNAQLIQDYRNEKLWNTGFATANWFRPDVDGKDYRYPHATQKHANYKESDYTLDPDGYKTE